MKKTRKKGFTIVELVIVIAVIAILAAVLIPTFSGVIERAKQSNAMQSARSAYYDYMAGQVSDKVTTDSFNLCIYSDGYFFHVVRGQFDTTATPAAEDAITESTHSLTTGTKFDEGKTPTPMKVEGGKLVLVANNVGQ